MLHKTPIYVSTSRPDICSPTCAEWPSQSLGGFLPTVNPASPTAARSLSSEVGSPPALLSLPSLESDISVPSRQSRQSQEAPHSERSLSYDDPLPISFLAPALPALLAMPMCSLPSNLTSLAPSPRRRNGLIRARTSSASQEVRSHVHFAAQPVDMPEAAEIVMPKLPLLTPLKILPASPQKSRLAPPDVHPNNPHSPKETTLPATAAVAQASEPDDAQGPEISPELLARRRDVSTAYELGEKCGEGTYGEVFIATVAGDAEDAARALKKVDYLDNEGNVAERVNREVGAMAALRDHPHVVTLHEVVCSHEVSPPTHVYLVMDLMDFDLHYLTRRQRRFLTPGVVKNMCRKLLIGLDFIHSQDYIHRDLKPSNLLYSNGGAFKIGDFGLARKVTDRIEPGDDDRDPLRAPPGGPYTKRIGSFPYCAPELLLGGPLDDVEYGQAVDVWAAGCCLYEMLAGDILFPGLGSLEVRRMVVDKIGPITEMGRERGGKKKEDIAAGLRWGIEQVDGSICEEGLDLLVGMLTVDPNERLTAAQALAHPYFREGPLPCDDAEMPLFESQVGTEGYVLGWCTDNSYC